MDNTKCPSETSTMLLPFKEDTALTEMMRLRASSLQRSGQRRSEGERVLLPHEAVYRLDFPSPRLAFLHWRCALTGPGRVSVTGISQLWTPDLTHLMTRQLLEPVGAFWRDRGDGEEGGEGELKCLEADMQEFGERVAELAAVRRFMYFLVGVRDGAQAGNMSCALEFTPLK